jgi:hypothetical protein
LIPGPRFRCGEVAAILSEVITERGAPAVIQCDQVTEFTSIIMDVGVLESRADKLWPAWHAG